MDLTNFSERVDSLTLSETRDMMKETGSRSFSELFDDLNSGEITDKAIHVIELVIYHSEKRTNPEFTKEDAGNLSFTDIVKALGKEAADANTDDSEQLTLDETEDTEDTEDTDSPLEN